MASRIVSPNPHLHAAVSTRSLMRDVVIALLPATAVSIVFYGWHELLLVAVSVASCVLLEWAITRYLLKKPSTIGDFSAVITGLLLALNVPSTCPWWVLAIGAVVAIGVAKMTFGGLGQNVFNPAITGRVFLLISFPAYMTNWAVPGSIGEAWGSSVVDAVSGATPLGIVKEGLASGMTLDEIYADNGFSYLEMLYSNLGGSAGELCVAALLLGFVYLLVRRVIKPHITLSIWASMFVFAGIFYLIDPSHFTDPVFNLLTGGVMLGSIYMATDYVTSPMSRSGMVVYGVGIGIITMLIRYFGAYPEGISFAILIMNAFVPIINRFCHNKKYGRA
ncbi:MAG: RnfABCDGE type electron transport complex subunit D [Bacteroidales bacterium]|nr:RnfABCDGE type electron transport complex subunit D [Bacteroidales bacterium]